MRNYFNQFETDGGNNQLFKRSLISKNQEYRPPILSNSETNRRFIIAFDPARQTDPSVIMVAELKKRKDGFYKAEIVNCLDLMDFETKSPLDSISQIQVIRNTILNYCHPDDSTYESIDSIMIDAGSGGGGILYADWLAQGFDDEDGIHHYGVIDKEQSADIADKYFDAINILHLITPTRYKTQAFDQLYDFLIRGLITFTDEFNPSDTSIGIRDDDGKEVEYFLNFNEVSSLLNIDIAKKELYGIYKYQTGNGGYTYDMNRESRTRSQHDDKAYVLALIALRLGQINRAEMQGSIKKDRKLEAPLIISNSTPSGSSKGLFSFGKFTGFDRVKKR